MTFLDHVYQGTFTFPLFVLTVAYMWSILVWRRPRIYHCTQREVHVANTKAVTIGNCTWLPMAIAAKGKFQRNHERVLETLQSFEKDHPNLEIISWHLQIGVNNKYEDGIWVDHQPRKLSSTHSTE